MSGSSREHCRAYEQLRYATDAAYREERKRKARARHHCLKGDVGTAVNRWKARLWRRYRMTTDDFFVLLDRQRGLCALCDRPLTPNRGGADIDHDHKTGHVRGLLCTLCNRSLGFYERWDKARLVAYLNG